MKYSEYPAGWQMMWQIRQAQAGNRINPAVFEKKKDASKVEGGFNFKEDKEIDWQEIFNWDGKKPLPEPPLPPYRFPKDDVLVPEVVGEDKLPLVDFNEVDDSGPVPFYRLHDNGDYKLWVTKDTARGLKHKKVAKVMFKL